MTTVFDVGIIGFGPTGATLAALLAARGWKVCVFDKHRDIYPKPRAIGMDHEAMRVFQRIGLTDELTTNFLPYNPTVYLGASGQPIQRIEITPPPNPLSWPPTSTFNQPVLEEALRKRVVQHDNISVLLEQDIVDCREVGGHVELRAQAKDTTTSKYFAHYVVAADGAESRTRRSLGISQENLEFEEDWIVADVSVAESAIHSLPKTNVQYCDPRRPTTYVVCPGNHRRWEFKILPGEHFEGEISNEFLCQLLAPWLTREQANIWRAAAYRFRAVVAERWRKGRILLAGDAAHLMPPFLGQGMCQGIRDAANLDWKLDRVLSAQSPDELLDTYQIERRSHVYEVTKAAKMLGTIVGELDSDRARARDEKLIADQGGAVKPKLRQAFIPGIFDGLIRRQTGASGRVFPQPFVEHGDELVRLDDLTQGKTVLMFRTAPERSTSIELSRLGASIGLVLATLAPRAGVEDQELLVVRESENILSHWFEANGCVAALIRPDHYVYGAAETDGESRSLLLAYLEALACR